MDLKLVEEQLKKVPEEIKRMFFSIDVAQQIGEIGMRNGLLLDQVDDLIQETGLTLIGLKSSKDFVNNITSVLKIDRAVAQKIAEEINSDVLMSVRKSIREDMENQGPAINTVSEMVASPENQKVDEISDVERLGDFTIEPQQGKDDRGIGHIESKARLINDIENPAPVEIDGFPDTEPLVDHLLSGPIVSTEKKTVVEAPKFTPKTSDPYREPIE